MSFWQVIAEQIEEARTARSADDVLRIFAAERDPYGPGHSHQTSAFFAGSGGDLTVSEALREAGWRTVWSEAHYWWCMAAPDGSMVTYVEGDIYPGNTQRPASVA